MSRYIQVITTVTGTEDADTLARRIVELHLAGCVQISPCRSTYRWQGRLEQEEELKLVMKSRADLFPLLEQFLLELHPYDTPEILAVPIQHMSRAYQDWLDGELRPEVSND